MVVPMFARDVADAALAHLRGAVDGDEKAMRWAEASVEQLVEVLCSGRIGNLEPTLLVCAESACEYGLSEAAVRPAGAALARALFEAGKIVTPTHPLASAYAQLPPALSVEQETELELVGDDDEEIEETEGDGSEEPEEEEIEDVAALKLEPVSTNEEEAPRRRGGRRRQ